MTAPRPSLDAMFDPRSIAVVGASPTSRVGRAMVENLRVLGFKGAIYPINPRHQDVLGIRCYPSLKDLPQAPDAVLVGTARDRVLSTVEDAAAVGARSLVIPTAGFAERGADGIEMQTRLVEIARRAGMVLSGPNSVGILNNAVGAAMYIGVLQRAPERGPVSFVLQSGSFALVLSNSRRGLGMRHVISSGNEAMLTSADYVDYLAQDPGTTVIGLALEAVRDADGLLAAVERAATAGKRVVLLKVATSEAGRRVAASHTGALAGAAEVTAGVCRQFGIPLVEDLEELFQTCLVFSTLRQRSGPRVGIVALSGGGAALGVDLGHPRGLTFPDWGARAAERLRELPETTPTNPFDAWDWRTGDPEASLRASIGALATDDASDIGVVLRDISPADPVNTADIVATVVNIVAEFASPDKAMCVVGLLGEQPDAEIVGRLRAKGIPYLAGAGTAFRAIGHWAKIRPPRPRPRSTAIRSDGGALTPASLRAAGVPLAADALVASAEDARAAAAGIGYPVVLKVISAAIPHKTEAGVVALDVRADSIDRVFNELMRNAGRAAPGRPIDGVLVQKQAAPGLEMIVGASRDADWGWVVLCGLGGIFVEVFRDTAFRRVPLDEQDAREMLSELRAWPLLKGARGQAPYDIAALARILVSTSRLVEASGGAIGSLDLNPVLLYPEGEGAVVVDYLATPAAKDLTA